MGLFKPAWMGNNEDKAIHSVEMERKTSKLLEIIENATLISVKTAAAKKLTDQHALVDIIRDFHIDDKVRIAAMENLTDQVLLADLAKSGVGFEMHAVKKLTDQTILEDIVNNARSFVVRGIALKNLKNKSILIKYSKSENINDLVEWFCATIALYKTGHMQKSDFDSKMTTIMNTLKDKASRDDFAIQHFSEVLTSDECIKMEIEIKEAAVHNNYNEGGGYSTEQYARHYANVYFKGDYIGRYSTTINQM